uniref:Glycoside hydrolase family 3 protein n=1 Tax=Juncus prismatocarpus subsp. leschenaultii TaxID=308405 RepID=A0A510LC64_9POAL|nr:glycoside hydrolase family 3 protein [Juncus prismatocarpus subsp. leschenaultii]
MPESDRDSVMEKAIQEFDEITRDASKVQRETLKRILEENGETEYLQNLGLKGRTDIESYRACVPLVTHKDIAPYIQRIVDGDNSKILTGKPVTSISLSSGTTQGKPKYLLFNEELVLNTMEIYRLSYAFRNREFPLEKGRALQFIYGSKQLKTNGGLTLTTATTNVYLSSQFKSTLKSIQSQCTSPDEVIFCPDFLQSLYCHLLCGLLYKDQVQFISATFAHSLVVAFQSFEKDYLVLINDVRTGVLSDKITNTIIRTAVSEILHPNPELADEIFKICEGLSNWYGVIQEIWPNCKYVYGIMTGSMEHYTRKLKHYAGTLPLVCSEYGSSEGWIGSVVDPKKPPESACFAIVPDIGFFEFIPLKNNDDDGNCEPVGLTEVQVGEEYEIIITTFAGLYRYRLGDILRVEGFYNSTPLVKFMCRKNLILTINVDKNTEKDLQLVIDEASKLLSAEKLDLLDYTSYADVSSDPGHYVIFWELNSQAKEEVLQNCCDCMDRTFIDAAYMGSRKTGAIGPLELRVVEKGTFRKILYYYLSCGTSVGQFKTPRCVGACKIVLDILNEGVVERVFSRVYD